MRSVRLIALALVVILSRPVGLAQPDLARHVILVTLDGLRWQEFFGGADRDYFQRDRNGDGGPAERQFWRPTVDARRQALMPFVWETVATRGQIFGDPDAGSSSRVTNGLWFSYPGYNELLSGYPDPVINSNDKIPNPNVTVLEWLNGRPGFAGRVAAFGSWDVLPSMVNTARSRIPVGTGWTPMPAPASDRDRAINELANDLPRLWNYGPVDAPIVAAGLEYLRTKQPRVLYVLLGEGDEWAHENRYDLYLDATFRADRFIRRIWETAQSLPEYANRTALVITTDHGRGATVKDWSDHGRNIPAAARTWIAVMGPGVPALGVRRSLDVTTSQVAATVAALVGEQFTGGRFGAAAPLPLQR